MAVQIHSFKNMKLKDGGPNTVQIKRVLNCPGNILGYLI